MGITLSKLRYGDYFCHRSADEASKIIIGTHMTFTTAVPATNRLLDTLLHKDREQLLANCEHVELVIGEVLYRAGEVVPHIYFPTGGFISLVTPIDSANLKVGRPAMKAYSESPSCWVSKLHHLLSWFTGQSPHFFVYLNNDLSFNKCWSVILIWQ